MARDLCLISAASLHTNNTCDKMEEDCCVWNVGPGMKDNNKIVLKWSIAEHFYWKIFFIAGKCGYIKYR